MSRLSLASLAVNVALLFVVAFCLMGVAKRDATIRQLRADVVALRELREADAQRVRDVGLRNSALMAQQAVRCGEEGSDAFDRGVRTGMAVCQARGLRP